MNRRNFLTNLLLVIPGISILPKICLAKDKLGKSKSANKVQFFEQRTIEYLRNLPVWDESKIFEDKDFVYKEYLFTGGYEQESFLDKMAKEVGYVLVYTPRWIAQEGEGHFFDLVIVKIGEKNIVNTTGRTITV
jgi:hypothetical protein